MAYWNPKIETMPIKDLKVLQLKNLLNVGVDIELVEPGSLPRFGGKAKRVVDRRVY